MPGDWSRQIARLHKASLRDSGLAWCSLRFISAFYEAANDIEEATLHTRWEADRLQGFLLAATDGESLFKAVFQRIGIRLILHPRGILLAILHRFRAGRRMARRPIERGFEITFMAVAQQDRRSGLARDLLRSALDAFCVQSNGAVHLRVSKSNRAALALYEKAGFKKADAVGGKIVMLREGRL